MPRPEGSRRAEAEAGVQRPAVEHQSRVQADRRNTDSLPRTPSVTGPNHPTTLAPTSSAVNWGCHGLFPMGAGELEGAGAQVTQLTGAPD